MIYITEEIVSKLLNWNSTFQAVEAAMLSVSTERAVQNARTFTNVLNTQNVLLTMPGYLENGTFGAWGCKLVTVCPNNSNLQPPLPKIIANIMLLDRQTGNLEAIVAGTEITKWRTAAASAVATKYLYVNNSKECKVLAILGCGTQGIIHTEAFKHIFNFQEIRLWNRTSSTAKKVCEYLQGKYHGIVFKWYESNEECVRDADVIVTATFSPTPILKLEWVKNGAHINALGAGTNHHSELADDIYLNSDVYVDHRSGAKQELAGLEKLGVEFKGEIGEVISGNLGAPNAGRVTVFQSLGMAVEDCAMARMILDLYKKDENVK